jgi:hypothetical protein
MRDIFILNETWAKNKIYETWTKDKTYFGRHFAWLKYEACFIL